MSDQNALPVLRLMEPRDVASVMQLMVDSRFPLSGLASQSLYRAICQDGLKADRVLIGIAEIDRTVAGFLLVIVDYAAYWKSFLMRHPLVGVRMLWRRARRRKRFVNVWITLTLETRQAVSNIIEIEPCGRTWADSNPSIAKGIFMHIAPRFRRKGLAIVLYEFLFNILRQRGVSRCDAKVDIANTAAHPLHLRVGYRLERQGNTLFATRDL